MIKGYVVRVDHDEYRGFIWRVSPGCFAGCPIENRTVFVTLSEAIEASRMPKSPPCTVTILTLAEDGTETPLPTHEEALAKLASLYAKSRDMIAAFDRLYRGGIVMTPRDQAAMSAFDAAEAALRAEVIGLMPRTGGS